MVSFINLSLIAYLRAHRKHCYFWAVAMRQRFCVNTHSVKNQQSISWPHSQLWPFCTYHRSVPSLSISRDCLVTGNPCDWLWWCPYLQAFNLYWFSLLTLASKLGSLKDIPLPIPPLWLEESLLVMESFRLDKGFMGETQSRTHCEPSLLHQFCSSSTGGYLQSIGI